MKLTPWFDGKVKPVRKGWYECKVCDGDKHYFDGSNWFRRKTSTVPLEIMFRWRGILK